MPGGAAANCSRTRSSSPSRERSNAVDARRLAHRHLVNERERDRCGRTMICILTPYLGRDGGLAAHVGAATDALRSAGHTVTAIGGRAEEGLTLPALALDEPTRGEVEDVARAVAELSPDVVHLHDVHHPLLVSQLRKLAPVVVSAHNYPGCASNYYYFRPGRECTRAHGPLCLFHMGRYGGCLHGRDPRPIPRSYRMTQIRLAGMREADATVAYSSAVLANLHRNGLTRSYLVPLFTTVVVDLGQPEPEPVVLFAGRVVAAKGLEVLVRAMAEVPARLVVCGDGWASDRVRRVARAVGVAERTEFLGWTGAGELGRRLATCTVAVVPSLWPEPFGLAGIEAMAHARPVIASNTGGVPDWLVHGQNGLLVPPGDPRALASAIRELLADPQRARDMGEAGRRLVQSRFSPEAHVRALDEVYAAARRRHAA